MTVVAYSVTFNDRSCLICRTTFDAGKSGATIVHCCRTCGHRLTDHGGKCRVCGNVCSIDCRPTWARARDGWPVRFPYLTELTNRTTGRTTTHPIRTAPESTARP